MTDILTRVREALTDGILYDCYRAYGSGLEDTRGKQIARRDESSIGARLRERQECAAEAMRDTLIAALTPVLTAEPLQPKECYHRHTTRQVGCVSCCIVFGNDEAPIDWQARALKAEKDRDRLLAGKFTQDEIHNICHDLRSTVPVDEFANGCHVQQLRLYGSSPYADRAREAETRAEQAEAERDRLREALTQIVSWSHCDDDGSDDRNHSVMCRKCLASEALTPPQEQP